MIGIIDYGMGNLRSVQKALELLGHEACIVRDPADVSAMDRLILPGIGAFDDAMRNLRVGGFVEPILAFIDSGRPFLGICLGLHLLFERSEEGAAEEPGLGVLPGRVVRFRPTNHAMKVPHMGWNALHFDQSRAACPLLTELSSGCYVYFVHSYYVRPDDEAVVLTRTDYDGWFCSSVGVGNVFATQFHPEKSQRVGLTMLRNFARMSLTDADRLPLRGVRPA